MNIQLPPELTEAQWDLLVERAHADVIVQTFLHLYVKGLPIVETMTQLIVELSKQNAATMERCFELAQHTPVSTIRPHDHREQITQKEKKPPGPGRPQYPGPASTTHCVHGSDGAFGPCSICGWRGKRNAEVQS